MRLFSVIGPIEGSMRRLGYGVEFNDGSVFVAWGDTPGSDWTRCSSLNRLKEGLRDEQQVSDVVEFTITELELSRRAFEEVLRDDPERARQLGIQLPGVQNHASGVAGSVFQARDVTGTFHIGS